jgi:hypothetical protein
MAGVKRFVTYIYAYEEGRKAGNAGFAKIEIRGEESRIEVHVQGICPAGNVCTLYLFRANGEEMQGIEIGELPILAGKGEMLYRLKTAKIEKSPYSIYDMDGLLLLGKENQIWLSRWKEGVAVEVRPENLKIWNEADKKQATGEHQTENAEDHEPQTNPDETIAATEVPMRNIFPEYNWRESWEKLQTNNPQMVLRQDTVCVQIALKEIRELPRQYWSLGNNSFLLHGFFNYRYLVVGKMENDNEESWFLGVPGVYQRQERVMAAVFGFPEFMPVAEDAHKAVADREPLGQFGYWCRNIDE